MCIITLSIDYYNALVMVTTTYHTSSSNSSLISLTDEEVIYKKRQKITFTLERERKKRERKREEREGGEGEREGDNSLTRMILLLMTLEQWDIRWSMAMHWNSVSSISSPQRLRTLKQR